MDEKSCIIFTHQQSFGNLKQNFKGLQMKTNKVTLIVFLCKSAI